MAHKGPIQAWDYLAISTIVPSLKGERISAPCALCREDAWMDPKGALYTAPENCSVVCDACGDREAPEAMALVRRLRACENLTVAVGGPDLDDDPWAWTCPICSREQEPDDLVDEGAWRVVDARHGRSVCSDCLPTVGSELIELTKALEERERANRHFRSIDSDVRH